MARTVIKNRVKPYPGELFTSWLARNATINYLQTPTFVNCYFPEYKNRLLNRDTDVFVDREIAGNFAKRMLLDEKEVFDTSLQSYSGYLNESVEPKTRNHLLTPIKVRGGYPRIKGLRYCPECLKEQECFRKEWRLSFYAVCPKHRNFLMDECPGCGEPVFLIKRKLDIEFFNCWNCGFVFKKAECRKLDRRSMADLYLENVMEIMKNGYFRKDGGCYYSISYFIALKQVAKLIYSRGFRKSSTLERECGVNGVEIRPVSEARGGVMEETMTVREAAAVFTAAFEVLETPAAMERFVRENRVRVSDLRRDLSYLPYWYEKAIEKFSGKIYSPSHEEIENAAKWMMSRGMEVSYSSLSRITGTVLDVRKRPKLKKLVRKT